MKIGLIDLGSNTIKMAVYEAEGGEYLQCYYHATFAYLISFIKDGLLSSEGVAKITDTLRYYQREAGQQGCDRLECFSTASLRFIENQQAVLDEVHLQTGITIRPLSGEEEAYFNFLSMQSIAGCDDFLGGDLGGGSMQLFSCQEGKLAQAQSFPLGALKLYESFVSGVLPIAAEAEKITAHVRQTLDSSEFHIQSAEPVLYFMGGSARLLSELLKAPDQQFTRQQLENWIAYAVREPEKAKAQIEAIQPERLQTALPAALAINTVCQCFGCQQIQYTLNSVREGYLINLLKG